MAFFTIPNIRLAGISACVPSEITSNKNYSLFTEEESTQFINGTGIVNRHVVKNNICASDLCFSAAEKIIAELNWKKEEIDILIFVTQSPDYILPSTAPILQDRLKLPITCLSFDISLGCSGYVYGLNVITSLLSHGSCKKGLLLVGDSISRYCSDEDKSTSPLFGDAGTATALEYFDGADDILFNLNTDGSGYKAISIEDGASRNKTNHNSFIRKDFDTKIRRNNLELYLDGMEVFYFGINKAPSVINDLLNKFNIKTDEIDYYVLHQANLYMNETIRKKLKVSKEKFLYSIAKYGNTSGASIPLTIVSELNQISISKKFNLLLCGFGVGLSWGSVYIKANNIACPNIIEI